MAVSCASQKRRFRPIVEESQLTEQRELNEIIPAFIASR